MDYQKIIREQMKNYVGDDVEDLSDYAGNLSNGLSDNFTIDKILEATLNGRSIFDSQQIIDSLRELFIYEVKSALVIAAEILAVCIIIGLLKSLTDSFGKSSVSDIAGLVCTIVIIGLAMTNYYDIYTLTLDSVKTITYTMEILLPVLISIIIATGQVVSGTIMSPFLMGAITVFQSIIKNIIIPLIFLSTILTLINCLTEKDYVNRLSKFMRKAALFGTGLLITVMSGIIAVQGLMVKTTDSLIMGTAKYSIDNFIPIVGGFTSDTIGLFLKCMGSIKSIVGVFGIILIVTMILVPIIKIGTVALIYKITGLLLEPVAPKKITEGVSDIGASLVTMGAVLFFSSLLFIIFITSLISIGGSG